MRAVDRKSLDAPKVLTQDDKGGAKELDKARIWRADTDPKKKSFPFKVYKHAEVKAALEKLFHGKCAYCESFYSAQAPVDVEHFRPKGAVEGEAEHPGYWWIAMEWENLLPSCIDCNRRRRQPTPVPSDSLVKLRERAVEVQNTGKKDVFPIAGRRAEAETDNLTLEQAYLLDPCRDDPEEHLTYHLDPDDMIALVLPRGDDATAVPALGETDAVVDGAASAGVSVRGAVSIQVYGLNRLGLVQARTRVLRHLEFLLDLICRIDEVAKVLEASGEPEIREAAQTLEGLIGRIVEEIKQMAEPDAPYSAMVAQWVDKFLGEFDGQEA
ncbi:hypothetical protein LCL97_19635 [Seohaeicola saemankumensis]|nr:hypothetical protein [Seohaeicola saemankumensis]MCA0873048.1 hypothetical protein [Seohaeicola saemankumensis]